MTKMTSNPFDARGVANPKYFANRGNLLDFFRENVMSCSKSKITRPDNIAIIGNWGVGKTSTLYKFRDILYNEMENDVSAFSVIFPLKPSVCINADTFASSLLDTLSKHYSVSMPLKNRVKDVIKEESKVWEKWRLEISFNPKLQRKEEKEEACRNVDLTNALLALWRKLEDNGIDIGVIMLDDIHYLLTEGWKGSLYDLRTDIQTLSAEGAKYLFVFTGPTFSYPEIHEIGEPFTRLFEKFEIGNFDFEGTKEVIEKPLLTEDLNIKISDEVIKRIYDLTEGHPFFIVYIMRDLIKKIKDDVADIEDFDKLYNYIIEHLTQTKFHDDFNKASDAERELLLKISELNKEVFSPSDIKGRSQTKLFERLTKKDLLIKIQRGRYKLCHPLFLEYLTRMNSL